MTSQSKCFWFLGLMGTLVVGASAACSSGGSSGSGGAGGAGGSSGAGATGGSSGAGGSAGAGASGGSAGAGASGGSAGQAGSGGSAGAGGSGTAGDHVLIAEVGILPAGAEFVELENPTSAAVDLSNYYLADNSAYHKLTSGPWNPQGTPGTDFLVQFPAGTSIPANGVLVVALSSTYEATFSACPDFVVNSTATAQGCGGNQVPAMLIPANGSAGDQDGALLSNDREMVVLFSWDGSASTVEDVDYVTWGANFDANTRVDKTGVAGYQPDTAAASQKPADPGLVDGGTGNLSVERCAVESGETLAGGNGLTGHDETSEDFGQSFKSLATPSPGTKNACQ